MLSAAISPLGIKAACYCCCKLECLLARHASVSGGCGRHGGRCQFCGEDGGGGTAAPVHAVGVGEGHDRQPQQPALRSPRVLHLQRPCLPQVTPFLYRDRLGVGVGEWVGEQKVINWHCLVSCVWRLSQGGGDKCVCVRACMSVRVCVLPNTEKQTVPEVQARDCSSLSGLEDGEGMGELVLLRCVVGVLCVACQLKCVVGVLCVACQLKCVVHWLVCCVLHVSWSVWLVCCVLQWDPAGHHGDTDTLRKLHVQGGSENWILWVPGKLSLLRGLDPAVEPLRTGTSAAEGVCVQGVGVGVGVVGGGGVTASSMPAQDLGLVRLKCEKAHWTLTFKMNVYIKLWVCNASVFGFCFQMVLSVAAEYLHTWRLMSSDDTMHKGSSVQMTPCTKAHEFRWRHAQRLMSSDDAMHKGSWVQMTPCTKAHQFRWRHAQRLISSDDAMHKGSSVQMTPCTKARQFRWHHAWRLISSKCACTKAH